MYFPLINYIKILIKDKLNDSIQEKVIFVLCYLQPAAVWHGTSLGSAPGPEGTGLIILADISLAVVLSLLFYRQRHC
jgi:hypothetical protein